MTCLNRIWHFAPLFLRNHPSLFLNSSLCFKQYHYVLLSVTSKWDWLYVQTDAHVHQLTSLTPHPLHPCPLLINYLEAWNRVCQGSSERWQWMKWKLSRADNRSIGNWQRTDNRWSVGWKLEGTLIFVWNRLPKIEFWIKSLEIDKDKWGREVQFLCLSATLASQSAHLSFYLLLHCLSVSDCF